MPNKESGDPDVAVLRQLQKAGDNPSLPRTINFYLYFPTEGAATSAAGDVASTGFTAVVRRAAKGPEWLCFATKRMVPTEEVLHAARRQLQAVADKYGGDYDGWESPLEKRSH